MTIDTFSKTVPLVDRDLTPTGEALRRLNAMIEALQSGTGTFVEQDQTPTWTAPTGTLSRGAFSAIASFPLTNPVTSGEGTILLNAIILTMQHLAALITDLRDNGTLTS